MRTRPSPGQIPDAPGSYQFLDQAGRVLYVGKAKSLRSRLANYFADPATLAPRTAQMVATADRVEWIQVANEVEAILLEYALIKRHRPRFNIRLADDKSYPSLAVTVGDEWPRAAVVRGRRRAGVRYFGPYAHVGAIRDTLDLLRRTFPVRTCSDNKFDRHRKLGKPCLLFHIERCSGPCIGAVQRDRYDAMVRDLMAFLAGDTDDVERRLTAEMEEAAEALDYERAARVRDRLHTLHMACERQQVVTDRPEDLDVVGIDDDPLEAAVCVLHVRRGRMVGRRGFVVDKVEDLTTAQLVGRVLEELYGDAVPSEAEPRRARVRGGDSSGWTSGAGDPRSWGSEGATGPEVPRQVLVPEMPDPAPVYEAFLTDRRGGPVALRVPKRGGKRSLLQTAARNAAEELTRHRLRRASDHASRARALQSLQEVLGLPQAPLRIECYDMSHLQGTDYVGSMVVLEDGLPRKSEYRRFRLKGVAGNDDYAAMEEVLTRRLTALLAARRETRGDDAVAGSARARRFAYPPQLLLLDGGKGQLGVGVRVLEQLGLSDEIPVAALAKSFEEVFVPGRPDPVPVPRGSDALFLLQRVRDEAHRFAITYHRDLRGKRMTASALEGVPGLGPARRTRLVRELGGVRALRAASRDDLGALPWLPDAVADAVYRHLHTPRPPRPPRSPLGPGPDDGRARTTRLAAPLGQDGSRRGGGGPPGRDGASQDGRSATDGA
ncbi:MAG TPA: excinuclease ABC subunit UvrC, partial [Acidimicrobiales bacterium]|nr:excinuclease ABC subunit UvrC [Acidimicrobiales bacterium]